MHENQTFCYIACITRISEVNSKKCSTQLLIKKCTKLKQIHYELSS